jgi:lysophospholipid acyltransferase (LPLAT)-like uncharacterized protein
MQASVEEQQRTAQERVDRAYEFADLSDYSVKDRLLIRLADLAFYLLINLIGLTARFEVIGWENHEGVEKKGVLPIYVFWHDRIFLTTYWWRKRRIVVYDLAELRRRESILHASFNAFWLRWVRGSSTQVVSLRLSK